MCNEVPAKKFLAYDNWSGRFFRSNMFELQQAVNEANAVLNAEGDLDVNTFYELLGLPGIGAGFDMGWSGTQIKVHFGAVLHPDGEPAISIDFREHPKPALGRS